MRLRVSALLCLFLFCLTSISTAFSQNIGKPAGYIKLEVPAASQRLSSVPFIPFNSAINSVFANMLTGENNGDTADRIVKWDAATQSYVIAFKCAGSGDVNKDGKWFLYGSFTPSSMTFSPGEGFWIQNQHDLTQTVFLSGHIVLNDTMTVRLYPNLNLFAYPYTSRIALNSSDLKNDGAQGASEQAGNPDVLSRVSPDASFWLKSLVGDVNDGKWMDSNNILTNESLKLGHSYWFNRRGNGAFDWTEVRPYANLFDTGISSPQITDIAPNASGDGIVLSITGTGAAGEKLLILYKDMSENESLDTGSAWKTAVKDLSVAGGDAVVTWTDSNGIANTFIRLYVAARQDIDSDNDGVSDAEERLVFGTNSTKADTDGDGISDAMEINTYHTNPLKTDTDGDGLSDSVELNTYHTDPLKVDTDNDGLSDKDEVAVYLTNPNLADTDGDGFSDSFEIQQKTNPNFKALATADGYKQELTVREDAEDGTIAGWSLYDNTPPGTIENVIDPDNSSNRCIKLTGGAQDTGYALTLPSKEKFQFKISWRMKYSESYTVYVDCDTNKGHRFVYYTNTYRDTLGTGEFVHHGTGVESAKGTWVAISRDVQRDLWDAQPDCNITTVNKIIVRGSGYIDDIKTFAYADADRDNIPYELEVNYGTDPLKFDTDGDSFSDYDEINKYGTDPVKSESSPAVLPSNWTGSLDINTAFAGHALSYKNSYELKASGSDIWNSADGFRFLYETIYGDCEITARVVSMDQSSSWAKAGIMIRETLDPNSKQISMLATPLSSGSLFARRTAVGSSTTGTNGLSDKIPLWVKLTRTGNLFSAFKSTDGINWTSVGTETLRMNTAIQAGLAFSANNNSVTAKAVFDNVSLKRTAPAPVLAPNGGVFRTSQSLEISSVIPDAQIRYTLDGSEPTESSALYSAPLSLTGTVLVKAKVFKTGYESSKSVEALFTNEYVPGLVGRYFNGYYNPLSKLDTANSVRATMSRQINYASTSGTLGDSVITDNFAVSFGGYIYIPRDGEYTFYLSGDDYARLLIDGSEIISNVRWDADKTAKAVLSRGMHNIKCEMTEGGYGARVILQWEGPGISKQVIPSANFFSADTDHDGQADVWEIARYGKLTSSDGSGDLDNDGISDADELSKFFTKPDSASSKPLPSVQVDGALAQGLAASYFKGLYTTFPSFPLLKLNSCGLVSALDYEYGSAKPFGDSGVSSGMAVAMDGYIDVPADGAYRFYLSSHFGSKVYIDGALAINNASGSYTTETSAELPLMAGKHALRIEFYFYNSQMKLVMEWEGPAFGRRQISPALFYSVNKLAELNGQKDADGDGVSDADEVKSGTSSGNSDSDGDGLSDYEEIYVYKTNPLKADTDNDGVNDYVEAKIALTNPLVADFNGSFTDIATINGSGLSASNEGGWNRDGNSIYAVDRNGWLEYLLNYPEKAVYKLELSVSQKNSLCTSSSFDLDLYIDGTYAGKQIVKTSGTAAGTAIWFMPEKAAGQHTAKIVWNNIENNTYLQVNSLKLQAAGGTDANTNGVSDWIENRNAKLRGITVPAETYVSPLCVEGENASIVGSVAVEGFYTPAGEDPLAPAVSRAAKNIWYADISLNPSATTNLTFTLQNSPEPFNASVTWKATNILNVSDISIRKNDSLLLTAFSGSDADGGTVRITVEGKEINLAANAPVPYKFENDGTILVSADYTPADGSGTIHGQMNVKVISSSFAYAPFIITSYETNWANPNISKDAFLECDDNLLFYAALPNIAVRGARSGDAWMDARLGEKGSILASTKVDVLGCVSHRNSGGYKVLDRFSDGSSLIEGQIVLSDVPDDLTIKLKIYTAGVTFEDGTIEKVLTKADFDENGVCRYRMLKPPFSPTSTCHGISFYQGDKLVANLLNW